MNESGSLRSFCGSLFGLGYFLFICFGDIIGFFIDHIRGHGIIAYQSQVTNDPYDPRFNDEKVKFSANGERQPKIHNLFHLR